MGIAPQRFCVGSAPREETYHAAAHREAQQTRAAWRELLSADRYRVLFEEETEPPGSCPLNQEKRPGTFICAACHLPLFVRGEIREWDRLASFTQPCRDTWTPSETSG